MITTNMVGTDPDIIKTTGVVTGVRVRQRVISVFFIHEKEDSCLQ